MTVCTDSDAARGMIHRVECGRVRHLQTRYFWHQQAVREEHFVVHRCGTKENASDLGTMVLEKEAMTRCMNKLAIVPATTLRGAIVAVLAEASGADKQMASIVDGCCTTQDKRIMGATAALMISAVTGGATIATILLWRAAMSRCDVWVRQTRSSVEVHG